MTAKKKIPIKKIENAKAMTNTFSRRKNGLFKKAHELSVMCDVQITILVYDKNNICHVYSSNKEEGGAERLAEQFVTKEFASHDPKRTYDAKPSPIVEQTRETWGDPEEDNRVAIVQVYDVSPAKHAVANSTESSAPSPPVEDEDGDGSASLRVSSVRTYHVLKDQAKRNRQKSNPFKEIEKPLPTPALSESDGMFPNFIAESRAKEDILEDINEFGEFDPCSPSHLSNTLYDFNLSQEPTSACVETEAGFFYQPHSTLQLEALNLDPFSATYTARSGSGTAIQPPVYPNSHSNPYGRQTLPNSCINLGGLGISRSVPSSPEKRRHPVWTSDLEMEIQLHKTSLSAEPCVHESLGLSDLDAQAAQLIAWMDDAQVEI